MDRRERFREYDYGPGAGVSMEAAGFWSGRRILLLGYRAHWINVHNGSVWDPSETGSNANHFIQAATAKLNVPVRGAFGLGFWIYMGGWIGHAGWAGGFRSELRIHPRRGIGVAVLANGGVASALDVAAAVATYIR